MQVIIKTRDLELKDLQFARLLKPYEDAGLVFDLPPGNAELEFLIDMVNDNTIEAEMFEHLLNTTHLDMSPSEMYSHLQKRDSHIPTLYFARMKNDRFHDIRKIQKHQELQSVLSVLSSRGIIEGVDHLL